MKGLARRPLPLATLTASVIATMLLLSVAIAYVGVTGYSTYLEETNARSLPAAAADANRLINEGLVPDAQALRVLVDHLDALAAPTDLKIRIATVVIGLASALICAVVGVFLVRRIARPLESLTGAAEILRSGDFSARVGVPSGSSREVASLVGSFNALATSLDLMEERLRFNNMAIAHELRTPLTVLRGGLQGILDGVFPMERQAMADLLLQVEGLAKIVEDLRTLSLAIGQKLVIEREPLDVAQVVETVLSVARPMLEAKGMTLETELRPAPIEADAARVRQCVLALLENASRYADRGGWLRCETEGLPDGSAVIRILDRGPGFPAEAEGITIDPFWRGDSSRSRATGGTGLGLSVVQALARAHNGQLSVGNRAGGGAELSIVLGPETP